jgi:hypothetical protein
VTGKRIFVIWLVLAVWLIGAQVVRAFAEMRYADVFLWIVVGVVSSIALYEVLCAD